MIGKTLGHYTIVDRLGAGGMGEVFRAEDTTLKRQVALKVLPAELAEDSDRLERFQREAEALAALNHPNIVMIHSIETAEGVRFLTMELVEGKSLGEVIPERGLGLGRIFDIAVPLADALGAAHAKGVVHRDIKPGNVMVTGEGRVKFLDFGLAKLHSTETVGDASQIETQPLTQEGLLIGTVPYMAPEQLEGGRADVRSDVFSLGVLLYEMATGERPFQGENPVALISSILKKSPQPVSAVRQELPPHLGRIIERCLAKDPDERYQSAGEIRDELSRLRREIESGMTRTEISDTLPLPAGRNSAWKRLLAPVAIVAAVVSGVSLWLTRSERPASDRQAAVKAVPKLVVLPFENLGPSDQAYFTDGMTEEITSRLAGVSGLRVISRTTALQYKDTQSSIPQLAEELGVDYVLDGTVRWASGESDSRVRITPQLIRVTDDTPLWSSTYDRVLEDTFAVQSEIARQVIDELGIALRASEETTIESRPTDNLEAYQAYLRGKNFLQDWGNEESLLAALEMFERAVELDPEFVLAHLELYEAHWSLATYFERAGSAEASRAALARAQELGPDLPPVRRMMLWNEPDAEKAEAGFRALLELEPSDSASWGGLGEALHRQGDYAEGLQARRRAVELDPRHDLVVVSAAVGYTSLRRYDEAAGYYERLLEIAPHVVTYYWLAARNQMLAGSLVAARQLMERMPDRRDAWWHFYWYELLRLEGRLDEALEVLADATLPREDVLFMEAELHRARGAMELERDLLLEALPMFEERLAPDSTEEHPGQQGGIRAQDDTEGHSLLGLIYASLGRREETVRQIELLTDLRPLAPALQFSDSFIAERIALMHARLDDLDLAVEQLDRALSIPSFVSVPHLRLDSRYDLLREHPGFQELLERHAGPFPLNTG